MCCWTVLQKFCSISLAWWGIPCANSIEKFSPLVALCSLQGGISWTIQVLGVLFEVLWSHILGGPIDGEIYVGGLEGGAVT